MSKSPKYPVVVHLVGQDGNGFAILGRTCHAMREARVPSKQIAKFMKDAAARDYDNLLVTVMRWADVR